MTHDSSSSYPDSAALLSRLGLKAAHDLNNLIAVISGNLYLLRLETSAAATNGAAGTASAATNGTAGTAGASESLKAIEEAVAGLGRLSKSLSTVGTAYGPYRTVDVNALVREVAAASGAPPPELDLADGLPELMASPDALRAALRALVDNARLAASGAAPRIATRRDGDALVLSVEDHGPGIPPEYAGRAFDPFFSTRGRGRGAGIGLFVAAAVASAHGGSCRLEGRQGGGTAASIRLRIP